MSGWSQSSPAAAKGTQESPQKTVERRNCSKYAAAQRVLRLSRITDSYVSGRKMPHPSPRLCLLRGSLLPMPHYVVGYLGNICRDKQERLLLKLIQEVDFQWSDMQCPMRNHQTIRHTFARNSPNMNYCHSGDCLGRCHMNGFHNPRSLLCRLSRLMHNRKCIEI